MLKLLGVVVAVAVAGYAGLWVASAPTTVAWERTPSVVGPAAKFSIKVKSAYGIARTLATLTQGSVECKVFDKESGLGRFSFFRRKPAEETVAFGANAAACAGLTAGPARLDVTVKSADPRGRSDGLTQQVQVTLTPAFVHTGFEPHYSSHAGPAAVRYTVGGDWVSTGVRVGRFVFRAFPLPGTRVNPGEKGTMVSLFTIPYDADPEEQVVVFVKTSDGRDLTANVRMVLEQSKFRERSIKLTKKFLERAVGDILGGNDGGDPLAKFRKINSDVRSANNRKLWELSRNSAGSVLWSGPFIQLPKSSLQGLFADMRIYTFDGEEVDRQVHLGLDMASTRNAPVPAANAGKVALAERLGIYGNCVVLDHGLGLQTIYAHLSRIEVQAGADVVRGQTVGLSGMTGLAGGDHLHYGMLIDGVEVNPKRLFERNWIAKNLASAVPVQGLEKPAGEPAPAKKRGRRGDTE